MDTALGFLRLRDLMLLEQIQQLGTLRAVAQALHLTQPAVTQILKGLEDAFGLPLVERGRRGVQLNAAGQAALLRLGCAFQETELARQDAHQAAQPLLRIGATPMASLQTLPRLVERLRQLLPQARLALSESGADALWQQLAQGELDAVVARLPSAGRLGGIRHQVVAQEQMVLVCRKGHGLGNASLPRQRLPWLQALAQQEWVLPPQDALTLMDFNAWFLQSGLHPPAPVVTSGSFSASLHLVAQTSLLSLVPQSAFRGLADSLQLQSLVTPWKMPTVSIVLAARATRWESEPIRHLRESLQGGVS